MIRSPCFPTHKVWTHLAVKCGPHQLGIHSQQSEEDEVGQDGRVQQIYRSGGKGLRDRWDNWVIGTGYGSRSVYSR